MGLNIKMRFVFLTLLLSATVSLAQTDTLIFANGNIVVGEIKSMSRGIIEIETDYSDSDFKIEWDKVAGIRDAGYAIRDTGCVIRDT